MQGMRIVLASGLVLAATALADTPPVLTATQSDPQVLGLMQGSPVPPDKQVRSDDGSMFAFPKTRWAYANQQALLPTVPVHRAGPVSPLPMALRKELGGISFTTPDGHGSSLDEAFDASYADGLLILHRGRIVYERYAGALQPDGRHTAMSATKSFVGTLALLLIQEGRLAPNQAAASYVPELSGSGFGHATVRDILDMRTSIAFDEEYVGIGAQLTDVTRMMIAAGIAPAPAGYDAPPGSFAFVSGLGGEDRHGGDFVYRTPNTLALQWIVERAGSAPFATQLAERIWKPMGMEQEAAVVVDRIGTAFGGGGLNASLRDMARFGEMIRNRGRWNNRQILPEAVAREILSPGDPAAFVKARYPGLAGGSYANQWWHRATGQAMALGVGGQLICIDPANQLVIVRFASHPVASNRKTLPATLAAIDAVTDFLARDQRQNPATPAGRH